MRNTERSVLGRSESVPPQNPKPEALGILLQDKTVASLSMKVANSCCGHGIVPAEFRVQGPFHRRIDPGACVCDSLSMV